MKNFLFLALLITFSAHAGMQNVEVISHGKMSVKAGVDMLRNRLEGTRFINRTQTFAFESVDSNYSRGDFVILWGVGSSTSDQTITETEYKGLWRVMNYLADKDFRVILNVKSTSADLSDAMKSETSSVVLFSSHGNESAFYGFDHEKVAYDVLENRSPSVYQFILSACYGAKALRKNYVVPDDLKVYAWEGLTNSTELLDFLVSDSWSGLEHK